MVSVTRGWAGRDHAILPEPASSQKPAQKRGESHPSGARCVGWHHGTQALQSERNRTLPKRTDSILT